ncbi:NAD(P)/FAD-dependent oxidoreductase [Candidatus Magnetaquicoccus inordinatus]|uniref:NAD(P)/FAD-dependent oxidoreductase n=1 Tax=Candidatus Magnetaquicoccus inordinatus TaxID=2496818 RepID=UPI00102C5B80|nr:hypothetical protein [Candidatus Magnetaquicoccus inordinatus]
MKLANGSTVAIVGGGPGGTLSAIFLLDLARQLRLQLSIDIYEPKRYNCTGPTGCNMCGGVISESLIQMLAAEGILLPNSVVIDTINAYILHTDQESARIDAPRQEMRIATIFRGAGPKGSEHQLPLPWQSFDQFLLQMAIANGARHLPYAVTELSREQGFPVVSCANQPPQRYDLLVGAVGINQKKSLQLFEALDFAYQRPQTTRAYVAELYYGAEQVQQHLGHAMHVFLLNIPHLKFAAITPKGHYATLVILGDHIDQEVIEQFFAAPEVKKCLPQGWEIPVQPCHCQPSIVVGPASNPFGDRVVMVGDASVSRLYKDGIGSAYRMAKRLAYTALAHGVAASDFKKHYWPVCRSLLWDNRLGHLLFACDNLFRFFPLLRQAMMAVLRRERCQAEGNACPLSSAFWNTFTGSATYMHIAGELLQWKTLWNLLSLLRPGRNSHH